jgi:hypothetical protein
MANDAAILPRPSHGTDGAATRHLHMVEEHGDKHGYDRKALGDYFLKNYNRLFGSIRKSKALDSSPINFEKS